MAVTSADGPVAAGAQSSRAPFEALNAASFSRLTLPTPRNVSARVDGGVGRGHGVDVVVDRRGERRDQRTGRRVESRDPTPRRGGIAHRDGRELATDVQPGLVRGDRQRPDLAVERRREAGHHARGHVERDHVAARHGVLPGGRTGRPGVAEAAAGVHRVADDGGVPHHAVDLRRRKRVAGHGHRRLRVIGVLRRRVRDRRRRGERHGGETCGEEEGGQGGRCAAARTRATCHGNDPGSGSRGEAACSQPAADGCDGRRGRGALAWVGRHG